MFLLLYHAFLIKNKISYTFAFVWFCDYACVRVMITIMLPKVILSRHSLLQNQITIFI